MRAPYQILAIPYKFIEDEPMFCVFKRANNNQWQFIAGGGEDLETPYEAAIREIFEESGLIVKDLITLKSKCYVPTTIFKDIKIFNWPDKTYVIPEHAFGFLCINDIILSDEHISYKWLKYEDAFSILKWDSNRTAMYELKCIINE